MPHAPRLILLAMALAVAGCAPSTPRERSNASPLPTRPSRAQGENLRLTRPVATPVDASDTASASIAVAVKPGGDIPFNGQSLPLVSPDGRFLVSQTGDPPTWPTILARPGAVVPSGIRLAIYAIEDGQPIPTGVRLDQDGTLLLGRSCNREGFLVESPRPGGERWVGFVEWLSGRLTWLVRDSAVNAHATLLRQSGTDVVMTRRDFAALETDLVIRRGSREDIIGNSGSSWWTPFMSDDPTTLCAFEARADGELHITAIDLTLTPPGIVARAVIARTDDPLLAWQATAAAQSPPPALPEIRTDGKRRGRALFHHPVEGRMCIFDIPSGVVIPLEEHSIAGAWNPAPASEGQIRGVFLTVPEGLSHQALMWTKPAGAPTATRGVHILGDAHVARLIDPESHTYLLIGPDPTRPVDRLKLTLMQAATSEGWFRVTR
ncbi:MAG: hypothetical protein KDA21_04885 [Phycisphaerales bacterium]|nr:hypothetical protein [Phycisphaerales bacterium]